MPTDTKTVSLITQACQTLAGNWTVRNTKMLDWHNILILENTLKQEDMESVISNDPRTGYNLALHLLTSSTVSHRIPIEGLSVSDVGKASYLESWVTKQWVGINENYRRRGRQGWLRDLVALMLSTGWFSVFSCATDDSVISELWHPSTVFQEFGDDLLQVAHIYPISTTAANRKMKLMNWTGQPFKTGSSITVYDWWFYDSDGDVSNGVVMGNQLMKSPVKETDYSRLPVFTGPVSGLPESGTLVKGNAWQEHFGEAIVATNENLQANYNKMLTFMQQMVRDTAQARWLELSNGENGILRQEDMFKRGAIFRGSPGEDARPLPVPPIPVELRTMMFDYQNMLQRGMFPWVLYGNLQMQLTGVAMSQIASAALQVLTPYQLAIKGLLTDIDNFWMSTIKETGARPAGFKMPKELKEIPLFDVDFNIDIPGFLVQRATAARMLDPNFKLSTTTVMDMLFPEVKNPLLEQARSQKDRADQHEVSVLIAMIRSYQEAAKMARDDNDTQTADLYDKVVVALEAQITAMGPKAGGQAGPISMPPERSEGRAMNVAQQEVPATEELGSQPPQGGV